MNTIDYDCILKWFDSILKTDWKLMAIKAWKRNDFKVDFTDPFHNF